MSWSDIQKTIYVVAKRGEIVALYSTMEKAQAFCYRRRLKPDTAGPEPEFGYSIDLHELDWPDPEPEYLNYAIQLLRGRQVVGSMLKDILGGGEYYSNTHGENVFVAGVRATSIDHAIELARIAYTEYSKAKARKEKGEEPLK